MQNFEKIKERFLKDDLPTRLGGLASNLARIKSFSQIPNNKQVLKDLIQESKFFIEWTAPTVSLNLQEKLVDLQLQLALLGYSSERKNIANVAGKWSVEILRLSGLLDN